MATELSAERFIAELEAYRSPDELRKIQRYFKSGEGPYGAGDSFLGVRMGQVFELAKAFIDMPPAEIERLLESELHEVRAGRMQYRDEAEMWKGTRDAIRSLKRRHDHRV